MDIKDLSFADKVNLMMENQIKVIGLTKNIETIKKFSLHDLAQDFPAIFCEDDEGKTHNPDFKRWDFDKELAFILRTVLKTSKLVHVPCTGLRTNWLNLTQNYGLKYPNQWTHFPILSRLLPKGILEIKEDGYLEASRIVHRSYWDEEKKCQIEKNQKEISFTIRFNELKNKKNIKFEKIEKYLEYIRLISKLEVRFSRFELSPVVENIKRMSKLSIYSDTGEYVELTKKYKSLKKNYDLYIHQGETLTKAQKILMNKIQKYNKPAKLLFKIKNPNFTL